MSRVEPWLASLAVAASVAACGADRASQPYQASADCPLRSLGDWQAFLENAASHPQWATTCSDLDNCNAALADFNAQVQTEIVDVLARCASDLASYPQLGSCSSRLRRFVPAWLRQHSDHHHGFDQANVAYFAAQTQPDKPARLMELPAELLAALPDGAAIEQVARAQGWPYLIHDSALGGTRFIFNLREPDDAFERWFVLGVDPTTWQVPSPSILSFIGLETPSAEQPRPHFRDYFVQAGDSGWSAELPSDFGGKCYACHPNGLRRLLPGAGTITLAEPVLGEPDFGAAVDRRELGLQRLAELNQRIASYPAPDWEASLDASVLGPALGAELGCPTCHDGKTRGALSVMTSEGTLWQKVVDQLSMGSPDDGRAIPDLAAMSLLERSTRGAALDEGESADLDAARARHERDFDQLMPSRHADLERWLLETGCE